MFFVLRNTMILVVVALGQVLFCVAVGSVWGAKAQFSACHAPMYHLHRKSDKSIKKWSIWQVGQSFGKKQI
jgi:hypothetical protein